MRKSDIILVRTSKQGPKKIKRISAWTVAAVISISSLGLMTLNSFDIPKGEAISVFAYSSPENPNPNATEVVQKKEVTPEKVISVLNKYLKGKLEGKGDVVYFYAKANHLSASLVTAILLQELGPNCTSNVFTQANNPCGINWNKERYSQYPQYGRYVEFPDVDTGLWEMCKLLNDCYISCGRLDIVSIGKKWAPENDYQQGMYGMDNKSWPAKVKKYYGMIFNEVYENEEE